MENRHLYRGKRTDTGEWGIGYVSRPHCTDTEKGIKSFYFFEATKRGVYDQCIVLADTICQCTGLKDKNGKLIWENDIVKRLDIHDIKEPSIGIIEYDVENTSFLIHWTDIANYSPTFPWKNRIGVIGNVFDNPELLEV